MRDIKSNTQISAALPAASYAVGDHEGAAIDIASAAPTASFYISVGSVGVDGTVDAKLQYSVDGATWEDEIEDERGNDTAITQIAAAMDTLLHVVRPRAKFYRVLVTVGTADCIVGVTAVLGPLHSVAPGA